MTWDGKLEIEALAESYSSGSATPLEVAEAVCKRVEAYVEQDPAVWITLLPREEVLEQARKLQEKYDGTAKPALYGVPFSVKDSIDVAGLDTTLACPSYAYRATKTAPVVQRVLDAGGIMIGKTNLDQFATGLNGTRSPYGAPRCVYDRDYVSGGSSSGGVVSVAAHLCTFAIATDTAGSTRVPAALNGMIGLKPTLGELSTEGLVPACKTADCITVIATNIEDTRAAWKAMKAYDPADIYARKVLPPLRAWPQSPTPVRFGVPPQHLLDLLSPDYGRLFRAALEKLAKIGMVAVPFDYKPFADAGDMLYGSSIVAQRVVAFKDYLDEHGYDKMHPVVKDIFLGSAGLDAVKAYQDIFALQGYRRQVELEYESNIDVLVVPSTVTHFTVAEMEADPIVRNKLLGTFTHYVNLLDLMGLAVPAGTWTNPKGNEMPFSITLIAPPGRDEQVMNLAKHFLQA